MTITLGYWDIRGLAQPIRLLLAHAGAQFQDKLYSCGPPPTFDKSTWLNEKFTLGLDFPNLPYLLDGDVKLTQSLSIMRYLADKYNLNGTTPVEKQRVYLVEQQLNDFRYQFGMICYNAEFEKLKVDYLKSLPDKLKLLSDFLGTRQYLAGDKLTYVDFMAYEFLDQQLELDSKSLHGYDNLKQLHARVGALENVSKYMASDKFIKFPINGGPAAWGGPHSKKD